MCVCVCVCLGGVGWGWGGFMEVNVQAAALWQPFVGGPNKIFPFLSYNVFCLDNSVDPSLRAKNITFAANYADFLNAEQRLMESPN